MVDAPPPPILPEKIKVPVEAIVPAPAPYTLWKPHPAIYSAFAMGKGLRGDLFFMDVNTAVLANVLDTSYSIGTGTVDSVTEAAALQEVDLGAVLAAATEEATKLGWNAKWRIDGGALIAQVLEAQADEVAASTFDLYARLAQRLGPDALRATSFDYEIAGA
jgi:hypothetical protein